MIARLLLLMLCTLAPLSLADQATRDPGKFFFNDTFGDFKEELQNARDAGKKGVLLMFEMDECPFCHYMKTRILNQSDVQDFYREHFLIFPVDIEGDIEITDFAGNMTTMKDFALKQYRVRATPVFAFFEVDGSYIKRARLTGKANNKEEFLMLGKYVVDGAYKTESFTRYKRSNR